MIDAGFIGADFYYKNEDTGKFTHLNFDFGNMAKDEKGNDNKARKLNTLLSDFENLSEGTYKWNGSKWVK